MSKKHINRVKNIAENSNLTEATESTPSDETEVETPPVKRIVSIAKATESTPVVETEVKVPAIKRIVSIAKATSSCDTAETLSTTDEVNIATV